MIFSGFQGRKVGSMPETAVTVDDLSGKRLVILGLARQGKALAVFAAEKGAEVVVSDRRQADRLGPALDEIVDLDLEMVLGEHPMNLLDGADLLAVSGGVAADLPLVVEAHRRGIPLTNDSLEFIKRAPAPVIGITGSAGKTTTTALTGAICEASGRRTWVGGNIGRPLIARLSEMEPNDIVVQELSSFQLEYWTRSPQVAAVLNITPNHLDRHKTMEAYTLAKANILRHQQPDEIAVLSADDAGAHSLRDEVRGRLRLFSQETAVDDGAFLAKDRLMLRDGEREKEVCPLTAIPLRGRHNVSNVLASIVLANSGGVPPEAMEPAIRHFPGVEHRLELVRRIDNVTFVNDSIATAPERAVAALLSFEEPVVLLAGGQDKDMVWESWAGAVNERVKCVILFGELAPLLESKLAEAAKVAGNGVPIWRVGSMGDAVNAAVEVARSGDIVLLSPGGTSFDAFNDFAERGRAYRRMIDALADRSENTKENESPIER